MKDKAELLEDMRINLEVDDKFSEKILKYFQVMLLEELLYHGSVRMGDVGLLQVKKMKSTGEITIALWPFKSFLEKFRKKYKVVHAIETED